MCARIKEPIDYNSKEEFQPVVIACATSALQEQLAGYEGDIIKLSQLLGLEIDARMAKDPRQYICDVRVNENIFFHDLWTRDDRIANGKLPILPSYSAVIFDEGHKILLPAALQAGQQINKEEIDNMILSLEEIQGAGDSLSSTTIAMEQASSDFFAYLESSIIADERSERLSLRINDTLLKAANTFHKALDHLLLEMQIEQELYFESLSISQIQAYEGQIERAIRALDRFCRNKSADTITWVDQRDGSFWVVPRNLIEMLDRNLFQKGLPVVLTSATLSNEGDFSYFIRTLGLKKLSKSTVGSPFDLEKQVVVYLTQSSNRIEDRFTLGIEKLVSLLNQNGGRALVLTNSLQEVRKIRRRLKGYQLSFEVLFLQQCCYFV